MVRRLRYLTTTLLLVMLSLATLPAGAVLAAYHPTALLDNKVPLNALSVVSIDDVANVTVVPQNVTVGDSEKVNVSLVINITNANTLSPVADLRWNLAFLDPQYFKISSLSATAYYVDTQGVKHNVPVTIDFPSSSSAYVDFTIGSVSSPNITIYVIASVPTTTKLTSLGTTIEYGLGGSIGNNLVQQLNFANTTVYIVHKPPKITVTVSPSILGKGVGTPGTVFNISLSIYDASGVYNATVSILNSSNKVIKQWVLGSSVTGNATNFNYLLTWNTTGLPEGNYTVVVKSFDILGIEPGVANTTIELRKGYIIPKDFSTLSDALKYPGVASGSVIYVESNVQENSTVVIDKSVTIVGSSGVTITFNNVSTGFRVTTPTQVSHLSIKGANTVFEVVNVGSPVVIDDVHAIASRFIKVVAPLSINYWNHTIKDSTLNGTQVAYVVGNMNISGKYSEAHLVFGSIVAKNFEVSNLYIVKSNLTTYDSKLGNVVANYSSIKGYDSVLSSWYGVASTCTCYAHVIVKVTFEGKVVTNAAVTIQNSLATITKYSNSTGYVDVWEPFMKCENTTVSTDYTVTIRASKKGLSNSATADLRNYPIITELALPVPKLSISVTNIFGQKVSNLVPGLVINVSSNYDLLTFNGKAYLVIQLLKSGSIISEVKVGISGSGTQVVNVMVPYESGSYSIKVNILLEGLYPVTTSWP